MDNQGFHGGFGEESTGKPLKPQAEESRQMPLSMLTEDSGQDPSDIDFGSSPVAFGAEEKSMISGGVLVMFLILTIGGGTLWAMRMSSSVGESNPEAQQASAKIDEALKRLSSKDQAQAGSLSSQSIDRFFKDADQVVAMFADDPVAKQVALEDLSKDPFQITVAKTKSADKGPSNEALAEKRRLEMIRKLEIELRGFKVQSVLSGRKSLAVINGDVVRPGDQIGSFVVTGITPLGVELEAEGESFKLSMAVPGN